MDDQELRNQARLMVAEGLVVDEATAIKLLKYTAAVEEQRRRDGTEQPRLDYRFRGRD